MKIIDKLIELIEVCIEEYSDALEFMENGSDDYEFTLDLLDRLSAARNALKG